MLVCLGFAGSALAQAPGTVNLRGSTVVVKPKIYDGVLVNPGIGFTTFQRFNGDALNKGVKWTEGFPIQYQPFHGNLKAEGSPDTSIAYFRVYWRFVEPEKGKYNWPMIDKALQTARARHQTLMLRIAPYGTNAKEDVPAWYRQETGEKYHKPIEGWFATKGAWMVDPENPDYVKEFGGFIRALGARYDGDPDLESVDISIVGPWGEGAGVNVLTKKTRRALLDAYLDSFHKTPLDVQLGDKMGARYAMKRAWSPRDSIAEENRAASLGEEKPRIAWRADCFGDMAKTRGGRPNWDEMMDAYPESIIEDGVEHAWKTAPVSMEACGVMQDWVNAGWDMPYILAQAIKWHVSSFNNKSSAVPKNMWPQVNEWLKKLGYRLALRRFAYPSVVGSSRKLVFESWWENQGDAPCYRKYPFAIRLSNGTQTAVMLTGADIRTWLPGDSLYNNSVFIPANLPDGEYTLSVAIVDPATHQPKVKMAIQGIEPDGWYPLGKIEVHQTLTAAEQSEATPKP